MNRSHDLLERIHAANPVPGSEHVDPDELATIFSVIEERRGVVTTTRTPVPNQTKKSRRRSWRPAVAFTATLALVLAAIGAAALITRGEDVEPDVGFTATTTVATPTTSDAPPDTTGAPPGTTTPSTTAPAPAEAIVRSLGDQPEFFTTMALSPDGFPVIASYTEEDGQGLARLFLCADETCETFEVVELFDLDWPGHSEGIEVAPDGSVYFTFGEEDTWRYHDGEIQEVHDVVNGPDLPNTFDLDDNPIIRGTKGWDPSDVVIVACADPLCAESTETVLATARFVNGPWLGGGVIATSDGGIRAVYSTGEPLRAPDPEAGYDGGDIAWTTYAVSCSTPDCSDGVTRSEVGSDVNLLPTYATLDNAENLVLWMPVWRELTPGHLPGGRSEHTVVTVRCNDAECSAPVTEVGPTYEVDNGTWPFWRIDGMPDLRPISAHATTIYDPDEYAAFVDEVTRILEQRLDQGWYEPPPLGVNLEVSRCSDAVCTSLETTTIATRDSSWYLDVVELEVAQDGTIFVVTATDASVDDAELVLRIFPDGVLEAVPPIEGTAQIQ